MIKIAVIIIYLQFFLLTNLMSINKLNYKLLFGSGNKEIIINNGLVNILDCDYSSIDCLLKKKILINNKSSVVISNVTLLNYSPSFFEVSTDSKVSFGNNTYLCFLKNNNLILENNYSLIIEGNVEINLMGSSLELSKKGAIKIMNGGSLIIKNGQINISSSNSIYFDPSVQLTLKNLKIELKKFDLEIASGSVFIDSKCKITSKDQFAIHFLSDGVFKILPKATLTLKDNVTFFYDPKVDLLNETQLQAKQHFLMADNSSTLILDSANILAKNYGISFDVGKILIYNNVSFQNSNSSLPAGAVSFDINYQCSVYLSKSAKLTILGIICG